MPSVIHTAVLAALLGSAMHTPPALATEQADRRLFQAARSYQGPSLELLQTLVDIDSGDVAGVEKVNQIVAAQLSKLGARIEMVQPEVADTAANIVATLQGSGIGRILMIAHSDTVFPEGSTKERPFRIDGERAYGPGIGDNKGGIVAAIYALHMLRELNMRDYGKITLLLNSGEEKGSRGARQLIGRLAQAHDVVFNLEPGSGDSVTVARKGAGSIDIEVKGRSSHAGIAPQDGRNAALELAHHFLSLGELANPKAGTTVNPTVIKAGDRTNVIPDHAMGKADVRVTTSVEFDRIDQALSAKEKQRHIPDTQVTLKLNRAFPPMPRNGGTDALLKKAQAIYREIGRDLGAVELGGSSDSGFAYDTGTPVLDGLGFAGGEGHTPNEYIEISSVAPRLYLLARLLIETGRQPPSRQ